jgi:hypothetical protein
MPNSSPGSQLQWFPCHVQNISLSPLPPKFFSNPIVFPKNISKITYAISFMKGRYAAELVNQQTEALLLLEEGQPGLTWAMFMASMNDIFDDPQDACTALAELQGLKQNKLSAREYFTSLKGLCVMLG